MRESTWHSLPFVWSVILLSASERHCAADFQEQLDYCIAVASPATVPRLLQRIH